MTSALHQISLTFDAEQDRLLLRLKTEDLSELRFWLTRRYIKLLWPLLLHLMDMDPLVSEQNDPLCQQAVRAFVHEEAVAKADFKQPYQPEVKATPLGDAPLLVSRISVRRTEPGKGVIAMHPQQGQGIDLALDHELLHSFAQLLSDVVSKSDWDVQLVLPHSSVSSAPPPGSLN